MSEGRKRFAIVFLAVVVGLLAGALLTEILRFTLPTGVVKTFFMKEVAFGLNTLNVNLGLIDFTFGFTMRFNFLALVAIGLTVYYFKWWL